MSNPKPLPACLFVLLAAAVSVACTKKQEGVTVAQASSSPASVNDQNQVRREQPILKPVPGEPPERFLIETLEAQYAAIREAGMKATVTASGRTVTLHPRIHSARKNACRTEPKREDVFECSLDLMVTLRENDREPGQHAERVTVHWDGVAGRWKPGSPPRNTRAKKGG